MCSSVSSALAASPSRSTWPLMTSMRWVGSSEYTEPPKVSVGHPGVAGQGWGVAAEAAADGGGAARTGAAALARGGASRGRDGGAGVTTGGAIGAEACTAAGTGVSAATICGGAGNGVGIGVGAGVTTDAAASGAVAGVDVNHPSDQAASATTVTTNAVPSATQRHDGFSEFAARSARDDIASGASSPGTRPKPRSASAFFSACRM